MNKKFLIFLILLIAAVSTITIASAAETIKVDTVDFNVPDGYSYNSEVTQQMEDEMGLNPGHISVLDNGEDLVVILVGDSENYTSMNDVLDENYPEKTINGKNGVFNEHAGDSMQSFGYIEDGKMIIISAPDETLIEQTIIK